MNIKKEISITLSKDDIIELVCEKFNLDKNSASINIKNTLVGDDRFGPTYEEFKSLTVKSIEL